MAASSSVFASCFSRKSAGNCREASTLWSALHSISRASPPAGWIGKREWLQKDGIHHAEDRRHRADAQGQREDCGERESRRSAKLAQCETNVARHLLHHGRPRCTRYASRVCVTPPKSRSAAVRPRSGAHASRRFSSVARSMWRAVLRRDRHRALAAKQRRERLNRMRIQSMERS